MKFLSATSFFSDIFEWFSSLSSKLPAIDYKTYFIVVVTLLIGIGVIVGLTYLGSYRFKLLLACKKIIRYLLDVEAIDNDNFGDFTAQCFSAKVPSTLRDCWVQYLGVRFGYPSDIVSEQNVYDKEVKRVREIRANVFIAIALVLIAIFAFWGYGRLDGNDMGVIFLAGLLLAGVIYLVLVILNKMLSNKCLYVFNNMQEDLDAKVVFQVEKSFATDSSPLADLSAIIDEIVARNTAKEIGFEFADEQTPIEELIAKAADNADNAENTNGDDNTIGEYAKVADEVEAEVGNVYENKEDDKDFSEDNSADSDENISIDDIIAENDVNEANDATEADDTTVEVNAEADAADIDGAGKTEEETVDGIDGVVDGEVKDEVKSESVNDGTEQPSDEIEIEAEPVEIVEEDEQKKNSLNDEINVDDVSDTESDVDSTSAQDDAESVKEQTEPPKADAEEKSESDENNSESSQAADTDSEPVIRYVMDGPADDDEIVKPAKLVKMPNLVDYMIAQNASPKVKMSIANMLMASYKKFENSDEDKKIIVDCIKKLMSDLKNDKPDENL